MYGEHLPCHTPSPALTPHQPSTLRRLALELFPDWIFLGYLFSSVESIHNELNTPPHSAHCAECGGVLGFFRFQAVLEKRYPQVARARRWSE